MEFYSFVFSPPQTKYLYMFSGLNLNVHGLCVRSEDISLMK